MSTLITLLATSNDEEVMPLDKRFGNLNCLFSMKYLKNHALIFFTKHAIKQIHNVATTSLQRRSNVTLQRRCNDVVTTLCVCWVRANKV